MRATVFGARGYVGRHLSANLKSSGYDVLEIGRGDTGWRGDSLGDVYYCAGLTADFRTKPFDTIDAHVSFLTEVLRAATFDSFVYLSSTRVYMRSPATAEDLPLSVSPLFGDDLYNISKLMGEAACLALNKPNVKIARLSNVFGGDYSSENFLTSVVRDAAIKGRVHLVTGLRSEKDYVWIGDVIEALRALTKPSPHRIVNVAHGTNTSHAQITDALIKATGCTVTEASGAPVVRFPTIDTKRMRTLAGSSRQSVCDFVPELVRAASAAL